MNTAVLLVLSLAISVAACSPAMPPPATGSVAYPYRADTAREAQILTGLARLRAGMTDSEVTHILGRPDEARPLYEPQMKRPKHVGYTWWYIVSADSLTDRDGRTLRISFDSNGQVLQVDQWGLEDPAIEPTAEPNRV